MAKKSDKGATAPKEESKMKAGQQERWAKLAQDPRFGRIDRRQTKVEIDDRFKAMLEDSDFTGAGTVDKRGRKVEKKANDLRHLYRLEEPATAEDKEESASEEEEEEEETGTVEQESDDEEEEHIEYQRDLREDILQTRNIPLGDATHRLALVNVDWDNLKAADLFTVFQSLCPNNGRLTDVKIYKSQFGKERMQAEEAQGPPKAIFEKSDVQLDLEHLGDSDLESEEEEEEEEEEDLGEVDEESEAESTAEEEEEEKHQEEGEINTLALRKYQLERLRYYYAILTFDSVATAQMVYTTADGSELEKTSNFIDLRYVPDEEAFAEEDVHDACESVSRNRPRLDFVTRALQQSNPKLTWDEDDRNRFVSLRRQFTKEDLRDLDFADYIASASESEEDEDQAAAKERKDVAKYRQMLLNGIAADVASDSDENDEEDVNITFASAFSEKGKEKKQEVDRKPKNRPQKHRPPKEEEEDSEEDAVMKATDGKEKMQHFDMKMIEKYDKIANKAKKSKKDLKKLAKLEKLGRGEDTLVGRNEDGTGDHFAIDLEDARFKDALDSSDFAIDPHAAQFKKTSNMQKVVKERQKRLHSQTEGAADEFAKKQKQTAPSAKSDKEKLQMLVNRLKTKKMKT